MGDHRTTIKISFNIHEKNYKQEWWINYFPDDDGVDNRIKEWFSDCWDDAYSRYNERITKIMKEARKNEIETQEKAELKKLLTKYGKKEKEGKAK